MISPCSPEQGFFYSEIKMAVKSIATTDTSNISPLRALNWQARVIAIFGMIVLLLLVILSSSAIGSTDISISSIFQLILSKIAPGSSNASLPPSIEIIIFNIRLPRILLAGLVGAALAVAGATYQGLFRNPMADPYLIGVTQGAGLGAVIGFFLPAAWHAFSVPLLAFIGALVSVFIVYLIARVGRTLPMTTLILAGIALGSFFSSITSYLMTASQDKLHGIISWLLGTFSTSNWEQVWIVLPYIAAGIIIIWLFARPLNVMQLDEEQARQLGINVERTKLILLFAATLITAAAVCFCGTIGFIGIIIPHTVRLIWGPDHRFLLPLSTFAGAVFLILADTITRTVLAPTEIPIGTITAFVGAPFFLYLLRQKKKAVF
jgi:iron complex transport system permease protein